MKSSQNTFKEQFTLILFSLEVNIGHIELLRGCWWPSVTPGAIIFIFVIYKNGTPWSWGMYNIAEPIIAEESWELLTKDDSQSGYISHNMIAGVASLWTRCNSYSLNNNNKWAFI